ncbi:MAG: type II secretion system protein [Candidatus Saccharimonadales bacterium]
MNTTRTKGFTIIEVVLVLAIAGLIFLMVFIALPALQKGQRDTQRRQDLSRFASQIAQYQANNKGSIPRGAAAGDCTAAAGNVAKFVTDYMTAGGQQWNDPQSGSTYTCVSPAGAEPTASGSYYYKSGYICNGEAVTAGTGRNFAIVTKLEGSGSACIDNK